MKKLKWSNYIVTFEDDEKTFLFKSITETLYSLSTEEYQIIDSYIKDEITAIDNTTKRHIAELYLDGMVVNRDIDEVEIFKSTFRDKMNSSKHGVIYFAPSLKCNLRCKYCIIGDSIESPCESTGRDMINEDAIQTAEWTYQMCNHHSIDELKVILYGGEPTMMHNTHLLFLKTLNSLIEQNDKNIKLNTMVITNGFKINKEKVRELVDIGVQTIQITLDGPPHIHDKRRYGVNREKTFNQILENLVYVSGYFKNAVIRVNVDDENASCIKELIDILHSNKLEQKCMLHFNLVDPSDFSEESGYNEETVHAFKKIYDYAFSKGFNVAPWRRYCSIPSKFYFAIDPDGNIYKCPNYLGTNGKEIGNVYSGIPYDCRVGKIKDDCYACKFVGVCNGGCEVMRETSKIGADYCFSKVNGEMIKAYYLALSNPSVIEKYHIKSLLR